MSFFDRVRNQPSNSKNDKMWNSISGTGKFESILQKSDEKPQLIYKHSHRCSVSFMAKKQLKEFAEEISNKANLFMIDVIHQRDLSNAIASELNVRHESPQVIILKDQGVIWKGSHWEIKGKDILYTLNKV